MAGAKKVVTIKNLCFHACYTVLEIGGNPKIDAPGIPKSPPERSCNSVHKSKISKQLNDVLLRKLNLEQILL